MKNEENTFKLGDHVLVSGNGTMQGSAFHVEEIAGDMVWISNEDGDEYCAPFDRLVLA